jgi:hypothetical protein
MKGENLIPPGAEAPAQQEDVAGSKEPFRSSDTIDCFDMF